MKKIILTCFMINIILSGISQIPIEMENLYELAIYSPNKAYMEENVKSTFISERWVKWNVKTSSIENYDQSGLLINKINIDSNLIIGAEKIKIQRINNEYNISRKISWSDFEKIRFMHSSFFWGKYFYFLDKLDDLKLNDSVTVTSNLTWASDSSIYYKTWLNSIILDSGKAVTAYSKFGPVSISICAARKKIFQNSLYDSIVICNSNSDSCNQIREIYMFLSGKLLKKVVQSKRDCELVSSDTVSYYYNLEGKILREEIYGLRGFIEKSKEYVYSNDNHYQYWIKVFNDKGELESKSLFNQDDKILERETIGWQGSLFTRKEVYQYNGRKLLTSVRYFDDEVLSYEKIIVYTYFYSSS